MSCCVNLSVKGCFGRRYLRAMSTSECSVWTTIRHCSIFLMSNLNFMEVLLLMYDVFHHVPAHIIEQEHQVHSEAITD